VRLQRACRAAMTVKSQKFRSESRAMLHFGDTIVDSEHLGAGLYRLWGSWAKILCSGQATREERENAGYTNWNRGY
jgi:hypothetical protein